MIDMHEIDNEINRLEKMDANYDILSKLAVLYSVKDHHHERIESRSHASSEFAQAISGASWDEALEILDEHMDAIRLLYPKEYSAIINRLKKIKIE